MNSKMLGHTPDAATKFLSTLSPTEQKRTIIAYISRHSGKDSISNLLEVLPRIGLNLADIATGWVCPLPKIAGRLAQVNLVNVSPTLDVRKLPGIMENVSTAIGRNDDETVIALLNSVSHKNMNSWATKNWKDKNQIRRVLGSADAKPSVKSGKGGAFERLYSIDKAAAAEFVATNIGFAPQYASLLLKSDQVVDFQKFSEHYGMRDQTLASLVLSTSTAPPLDWLATVDHGSEVTPELRAELLKRTARKAESAETALLFAAQLTPGSSQVYLNEVFRLQVSRSPAEAAELINLSADPPGNWMDALIAELPDNDPSKPFWQTRLEQQTGKLQ